MSSPPIIVIYIYIGLYEKIKRKINIHDDDHIENN